MLDLNNIRLVHTENLRPGDFAFLANHPTTPFFVIPTQSKPYAVPLASDAAGAPSGFVDEFHSTAAVVPDVEFEVDPRSMSSQSLGPGALVRWQDRLLVTLKINNLIGDHEIKTGLEKISHGKVYFSRWRALIRQGEREYIVFEQGLAAG